ncbi:MAG: amino acid ABC transporter substrate-binding protein, partial [Pseudomonadota bacterium]
CPGFVDAKVLAHSRRCAQQTLDARVFRARRHLFDIVKWTLNALIEAEEYGVTAANVEEMSTSSKNPGIQRLLGATPGMGKNLGVDEAWAKNAIAAVGNYGEIWTRNIEPLGLPRGLNKLWNDGGIMYAAPVR